MINNTGTGKVKGGFFWSHKVESGASTLRPWSYAYSVNDSILPSDLSAPSLQNFDCKVVAKNQSFAYW